MKRVEKDLLGEVSIDDTKYYGIQTFRALQNFSITGETIAKFPQLIDSFVKIKKLAAIANYELNLLTKEQKESIVKACDLVLKGRYEDQFVVDLIQGGAGTSTNMNINEVLANITLEIIGREKGDYNTISPNDHINLSQSTNDTYPSAVKVAVYESLNGLYLEMENLAKSFEEKAKASKSIYKVGRTQLQDAVPMTYGQSFYNYSNQIKDSIKYLKENAKALRGLNLGATAIGTGITAHPKYLETIKNHIKREIGEDFYILDDLFVGTQDASSFSLVSGGIKRFCLQLSKIANDLRLLSSGPRAGLGEIKLPERQAGSSIMPGKVNPVIPECINQICYQIIGYDTAISFCVEGGQLELNAFETLIAYNLLQGINILKNGLKMFKENCIEGLIINEETCLYYAKNNVSLATALTPHLGYKVSAEIAKKALEENKSVYEVVLELKLIPEEKLKEILDIKNMVEICS